MVQSFYSFQLFGSLLFLLLLLFFLKKKICMHMEFHNVLVALIHYVFLFVGLKPVASDMRSSQSNHPPSMCAPLAEML